ncbi:MAG: 50S ribosomal protein L29 [Tannerellaceae bacterium]|jgi:large subunit ribosomal protein L29|nr:50S ribosomal protein L29 [Tannerellaceae bacterium]
MKIIEVRGLSTKELIERIDSEVLAIVQKHINHTISPVENSSQFKKKRKDIARMKTELRWRELKSICKWKQGN